MKGLFLKDHVSVLNLDAVLCNELWNKGFLNFECTIKDQN